MKVLCLGAGGRISRESVLDLVEFSSFDTITVADVNEAAGREVVSWLDDPRVTFAKVDVYDEEAAVAFMRGYDVVMDGTPISVNAASTRCIARAGVHAINLNGMGPEWDYHDTFKAAGKICVPGFGMTPGVTNLLAKHAADKLETVETVRVSHGAFRPVAFSAAIAETTRYEYDPALPSRVVYEDGEFVQVEPFARPREIELPGPYGTHPQYIIPHGETKTLAESLADKGVRLIEVRGTWPPKNMQLVRTLYDWGFMRNDVVEIGGAKVGILDAIAAYLVQSPEGQTTDLYGYALHVEVVGTKDGKKIQYTMTHTHPPSDGSVEGWEKLRAYTRCVGIPMGIGTEMLATGRANGAGVVSPELAFDSGAVFGALEKRRILVHEDVKAL